MTESACLVDYGCDFETGESLNQQRVNSQADRNTMQHGSESLLFVEPVDVLRSKALHDSTL